MDASQLEKMLEQKHGGAPGAQAAWRRVIAACNTAELSPAVCADLLENLNDPAAASVMLTYWKQEIAHLLNICENDLSLRDFSRKSVVQSLAQCTAWLWERGQKETAARVVGYVSCCAEALADTDTRADLCAAVAQFLRKYGITKM